MSNTATLFPYKSNFKSNDFLLSEMSKISTYCSNICVCESTITRDGKDEELKNKFNIGLKTENTTNTYVFDKNITTPLFKF